MHVSINNVIQVSVYLRGLSKQLIGPTARAAVWNRVGVPVIDSTIVAVPNEVFNHVWQRLKEIDKNETEN